MATKSDSTSLTFLMDHSTAHGSESTEYHNILQNFSSRDEGSWNPEAYFFYILTDIYVLHIIKNNITFLWKLFIFLKFFCHGFTKKTSSKTTRHPKMFVLVSQREQDGAELLYMCDVTYTCEGEGIKRHLPMNWCDFSAVVSPEWLTWKGIFWSEHIRILRYSCLRLSCCN